MKSGFSWFYDIFTICCGCLFGIPRRCRLFSHAHAAVLLHHCVHVWGRHLLQGVPQLHPDPGDFLSYRRVDHARWCLHSVQSWDVQDDEWTQSPRGRFLTGHNTHPKLAFWLPILVAVWSMPPPPTFFLLFSYCFCWGSTIGMSTEMWFFSKAWIGWQKVVGGIFFSTIFVVYTQIHTPPPSPPIYNTYAQQSWAETKPTFLHQHSTRKIGMKILRFIQSPLPVPLIAHDVRS